MTTLTVNIDDKKTEKAVKAVLDALGVNYNVEKGKKTINDLNASEQVIYEGLKSSLEEIKLHREGKIKLQSAKDFLNEL